MTHQIAVLGYGRFGRALTALAAERGIRIRALDPQAEIPGDIAAAGYENLVDGSDLVVIATPIATIGPALRELRQMLDDTHTVIDVGSVKERPTAVMTEVLGSEIPWAATHPLFGPDNIARGDLDLRAVVCPNPHHPAAVERATDFYRRIGVSVLEQEPREHDQLMARTHAIAFFVAMGLIDTGADQGLAFTPPSFRALAQTIDTVRSDAAHLFLAIERANPHAAEARQSLIDALARVHAQLERDALDDPDDLVMPPRPVAPPALRETRDHIDDLDREIVRLLARRSGLASRAGSIKAEQGSPVRDPARELDLLDERRRWAENEGMDPDDIADVFSAVLRMSRDLQQ